jgi:membrane-associated protease RseP (regulator of RpoE activity)
MFWVMALLLGLRSKDPISLLAWVVAMFVAILVHELGHALAMRSYGFYPQILLYGLGGLADYGMGVRSGAELTPYSRIHISLAGPVAGILLAVAVALLVWLVGGHVELVRLLGVIPLPVIAEPFGSIALTAFLQSIIWIGIFWGLINLMPVYPLDGGQIARELLLMFNPQSGLEQSLTLSFYCSLFLAFVGFFMLSSMFMTLLFGFLAYNSYLLLRGRSVNW